MRNALMCFFNDLRVNDNPALDAALNQTKKLQCAYLGNVRSSNTLTLKIEVNAAAKTRFLAESLAELSEALKTVNANLQVIENNSLAAEKDPFAELVKLIEAEAITDICYNQIAGFDERQLMSRLQQTHPNVDFHCFQGNSLLDENNMPFAMANFPPSYSKFRKLIDEQFIQRPIAVANKLTVKKDKMAVNSYSASTDFVGGSNAGQNHLKNYLDEKYIDQYKQTRNELSGWQNSSKLSAWLALGCLSVRDVYQQIIDYEKAFGENDSSDWLKRELLWREYFYWYAHHWGAKLFSKQGLATKPLATVYQQQAFSDWCNGNTDFPLVNACMKELSATGFLSNRGRQIVASCLVNELNCDWRYGAAYFEAVLIDYDVATNWGNWQYIAGVGADPRGGRWFNIEKQRQQYDPEYAYINHWLGDIAQN